MNVMYLLFLCIYTILADVKHQRAVKRKHKALSTVCNYKVRRVVKIWVREYRPARVLLTSGTSRRDFVFSATVNAKCEEATARGARYLIAECGVPRDGAVAMVRDQATCVWPMAERSRPASTLRRRAAARRYPRALNRSPPAPQNPMTDTVRSK
ncbi:unnamed protein product [Arctia plantaginis]|uniref:Uncharacterized protein n=1 Tax=Arctia plantaginis TaxID=874455 RepID=A0A8S1BN25_ARCPL|nr:unnamed protein product [Arctia plantaginis]